MAIVFNKTDQSMVTLPNGQYMARNVPECTITAWAKVLTPEFVSVDIGTTTKGSFSQDDDVYIVTGSGTDIWNASDGFRFTYIQVSGDATFSARIIYLQNVHPHAKIGVMFRESLDPDSVFFHAASKPVNTSNLMFDYRSSTGATAANFTGISSPLPENEAWVRVQRVGNTFTAYSSLDGASWTQIGSSVTPGATMPSGMYVGLAITSHTDGTLCTGRFDNVGLVPAATGAERWIVQVTTGASMTNSRASLSLFTNGQWRASGRRTDAEGVTVLNSGGLAVLGRIYFLAARFGFSTGRLDLFINGVWDGSAAVSSWDGWSDDTEPLAASIGSRGNGASGFFDGVIDDVRLYHHLLSDDDIRGLYIAAGRDRQLPYVRWKLREGGSGTVANAEIRDIGEAQSHGSTATLLDTWPVYAPENIVAGRSASSR